MKKRIFSAIFLTALAMMLAILGITTFNFYESSRKSATKQLQNEAVLVIQGVENEGVSYFDGMEFTDYRITWIDSDGNVIYDSSLDVGETENHLEREEVQEALETGYGEATRYSSSILKQSFYVAYLMNDGTVMRLSYTTDSIIFVVVRSIYPLYIAVACAFGVAIALAFIISRKIVKPINHMDLEHPLENKIYPELQPLAERMDKQRKELLKEKENAEKNSLIRQEFTANVSHEMKTPLTAISGYAELIKDGIAKKEDIPQFAERIHEESSRMSKLVEDIMQLSKLDAGMGESEMVSVPLEPIVRNVIDSLTLVASEQGVSLKENLESISVKGVPDVLHSLVYNLVDNAIKYNRKDGEVTVLLKRGNHGEAVLTVSDTGIGIPNNELDRIFERFYRVDKSHSREIGGTGLGLSIVKHAASVHQAKIEVESTLGKGTSFRVIFPVIA